MRFTAKNVTRRDKRSQRIERHEQRNNIFVASQFWLLASGTKSYCRDRASCIYCILSRAISSLTGVFGQRLAWGNTAGTRMYRIRLCETVSNAVSERRHCHGTRAFFMFAFLRNNAPEDRDRDSMWCMFHGKWRERIEHERDHTTRHDRSISTHIGGIE